MKHASFSDERSSLVERDLTFSLKTFLALFRGQREINVAARFPVGGICVSRGGET